MKTQLPERTTKFQLVTGSRAGRNVQCAAPLEQQDCSLPLRHGRRAKKWLDYLLTIATKLSTRRSICPRDYTPSICYKLHSFPQRDVPQLRRGA